MRVMDVGNVRVRLLQRLGAIMSIATYFLSNGKITFQSVFISTTMVHLLS